MTAAGSKSMGVMVSDNEMSEEDQLAAAAAVMWDRLPADVRKDTLRTIPAGQQNDVAHLIRHGRRVIRDANKGK